MKPLVTLLWTFVLASLFAANPVMAQASKAPRNLNVAPAAANESRVALVIGNAA